MRPTLSQHALSVANLIGGLLLLLASSSSPAASFLLTGSSAAPATSFRHQLAALVKLRSPLRRLYPGPPVCRRPLLLQLLSSSFLELPAAGIADTAAAAQRTRAPRQSAAPPGHRMEPMLSPGDGIGGEGLHWAPPEADSSIIFMHGLGDTAEGWAEMLQVLQAAQLHTRTRLLLPTAPVRPVTLNMGMRMTAWSDIRGLTPDSSEDKEGLMASKRRIDDIIEAEIRRGISPSRIVVAGFSQGGAMAYLVGLTSANVLGGILTLSSWCPLGKEIQVSSHYVKAVPLLLHCHGSADELVRPVYGQMSLESIRNRLLDMGAPPQMCQERLNIKLYEGLGHAANAQELSDVKIFLSKILGGQ